MAAVASIDGREIVKTSSGQRISRGAASAVDLLSRLRGPLPEPETLDRRERPPPIVPWEPVEPTGADLVDFRRELQAAKRAGVPFHDAWPLARARVAASIPTAIGYKSPRKTFLSAIGATRSAWEEAYRDVGEPPRFVGALVAALDEDRDVEIVDGPRAVRSSW